MGNCFETLNASNEALRCYKRAMCDDLLSDSKSAALLCITKLLLSMKKEDDAVVYFNKYLETIFPSSELQEVCVVCTFYRR